MVRAAGDSNCLCYGRRLQRRQDDPKTTSGFAPVDDQLRWENYAVKKIGDRDLGGVEEFIESKPTSKATKTKDNAMSADGQVTVKCNELPDKQLRYYGEYQASAVLEAIRLRHVTSSSRFTRSERSKSQSFFPRLRLEMANAH